MVATKGQAIGFVVISILQLASGIAALALSKIMFDATYKASSAGLSLPSRSLWIWWIFGLPYLVPPIFGFLAAGFRQNGLVGAYMAFNIISMIVAAAFVVIFLMFLVSMAALGGITCSATAQGICQCRFGNAPTYLEGRVDAAVDESVGECDSLGSNIRLLYGVAAVVIIGWVLCLAGSIVCCVACCCSKPMAPVVVYAQASPGYEMGAPAYNQGHIQVKNVNY